MKKDTPQPSALGEECIRFEHVRKRFGVKSVFEDFSFQVFRGETLTLLGPSGSGKSVLLKMLIGLLPVDAGSIVLEGEQISTKSEQELGAVRRKIAYLFQGAALFDSLHVGENVAYGLREQCWDTMTEQEIQVRVEEALGYVGLSGIQAMRPSDLSGGMKKRVGLARTLALHPDVILYDEPTTGLDPINTARINQLILHLKRTLHLTSVVVTHDMTTAFEVSDRLIMLGQGGAYKTGTREEFQSCKDPYVLDFIHGRVPEDEKMEA